MAGIEPTPEPGRPPTIGEQIDFLNDLNEQTFEALSWNVERLKARVAFLEALLFGQAVTQ